MEARDRPLLARTRPARPGLSVRSEERYLIACAALAFTVLGILVVNPASLGPFFYYACLWGTFILVLHRDELSDFSFAFVVNSAFIAVFFMVQTWVYPDSYGTTSPLNSSWTDDSHFFSLAADTIPPTLLVRDQYFLYSHTFTTVIRWLTLFSIDHPMDVIFFQSGIAATLATFSKRYIFQLSGDRQLARTVYLLTLVCPFLMMNGGVIFLRDTFAAALFIYSLSCIADRRYLLALGAFVFHVALRPGTGLILLPAFVIIYWPEVMAFSRRHKFLVAGLVACLLAGLVLVLQTPPEVLALAAGTSEGGGVSFLGRELLDTLTADPDANVLFLSIQQLPFPIRVVLNGLYIFLYPFLGVKQAFSGDYFDLRSITMNLIAPVYALWLNAWFIAGAISKVRATRKQVRIVVAVVVTFFVIGTYSLQTRHKLIIYPLYYFVIAIGFHRATPKERRIGYLCSSTLLGLQVALAFR